MHEWDDLINKRKLRVSGLNPNKPPTFHSQPAFTPSGAFSRLTGGGVKPAGQFGADNSLEYPHDIHVGDPTKNPGFYQRTKDYSRMSSMWRDQQNSLRQMVAQDPNVKLPAGFGGKQNPGFARDYIHRGPAYEGLKGHRKTEQYIVYTNDGPELVGDIGQKSPFLNRLGNFVNGLLSFIPGLRDPQYRNQLRRIDTMQKDAIRTIKYHARGRLMNPNREMSDDDKKVVNGFLELYYVGEGMNVKEAKRAAAIMTQLQNKAPLEDIDKHMNEAIKDGVTDSGEILNHIKRNLSVTNDLGEIDFEDPATEEGENVPDEGSKLSYMLPEINHKQGGKSYKPEDCEFGEKFLGGQHLQGVATKGGKMLNLLPAHYKVLRSALEAAKREVHGNANSHIKDQLPTNPDQNAFDFILNNPAFNSTLNDATASAKNRIQSAIKNLKIKGDVERINPMLGYMLGNPEHIQNTVAAQGGLDRYDSTQPHTFFTPEQPSQIVQPNPADNIDVNSNDELALSELEPIDLAWSILKGA